MSPVIPFAKGHALGNDYIVIDADSLRGPRPPAAGWIRALCDRHRGVGADGLLLVDTSADPVALRIFNPDGTEAEKSGNGLRILAAYLHGRGLVGSDPFTVALGAERVTMRVEGADGDHDGDGNGDGALLIAVDMGAPSFQAADIDFDVSAASAESAGGEGLGPQRLTSTDGHEGAAGRPSSTVVVQPVSLGNPHCVRFVDALRREDFETIAPGLARHPAFRAGTNVQFARVAGRDAVEIWVWERGAGETLASGSSACAVVAAARRQGRIADDAVEVRMPGGTLEVEIGTDGALRLRGPAQVVYGGELRGAVAAAWSAAASEWPDQGRPDRGRRV